MTKFSIHNEFKPFYKIAKNESGRRLVIPDIHGFYETFTELLNKSGFTKDDQLFLLGDLIDKGKKTKEVLDLILYLLEKDYQIFPLRGNHEEMVLNSHFNTYDKETIILPMVSRGKGLRDSERKIFPKYLAFLEKLPYYYELDNFFLVHAGFDFTKQKPFEDYRSMIWIQEIQYDYEKSAGKTIIHGHVKIHIDDIISSIENKNSVIGLENALLMKSNPQYGNLVCLDIDSYKLYIQKNIDL